MNQTASASWHKHPFRHAQRFVLSAEMNLIIADRSRLLWTSSIAMMGLLGA